MSTAVLHVALHPVTGPWSVMRNLALTQAAGGDYAAVGIGVIATEQWPEAQRRELVGSPVRFFRAPTIRGSATIQYLLQRFVRPPIARWIDELCGSSGASRCIVHFHNAWMSGVFLPLARRHRPNIAVVATFHGVGTVLARQPIRRRLHRWYGARLVRFGASLTSVDAANLPLAESVIGIPTQRFTVIPNGVPALPGVVARTWSGDGPFVVGHVGTIWRGKGWHLLCEAALRLRGEGVPVRAVFAGVGEDAPELQRIAAAAPDTIEYRGYVEDPRRNLLPQLHALAVMSEHEGLPMTVLEALSVSLPVVATNVGGIPEAVRDGVEGHLVARDVDHLCAALRGWIANPTAWAAMAEAAGRRFATEYEIGRVSDMYSAFYRRAFASRH